MPFVSTTPAAQVLPHAASSHLEPMLEANTKMFQYFPTQPGSHFSTGSRISVCTENSVTNSQVSRESEESRNSHCMGSEVMQPFEIICSLNSAEANNHGTTFPILESAPSQYQLSNGTNPASSKHYRTNQNYIDNDSLLLLANCATLTTTENENPFTEQSMTYTVISMNTSSSASFGTHHPSIRCVQSAQDSCKTTSFSPAISSSRTCCQGYRHCSRGGHEQLNQSVNSNLQSFGSDMPLKQFSTIPELETQVSSLRYPTENFQAHLFSEEPYHVHLSHDILSNQ